MPDRIHPAPSALRRSPLSAPTSLFGLCAACVWLAACDSPVVVSMPSPDAASGPTDDHHGHDGGDGCNGRGLSEFEEDHVLFSNDGNHDAGDGGTGFELRMLEAEPNPPVVGNNSWLVKVTHDGKPLIGAEGDIVVTPFMPDHGHGTPTTVSVTETTDGVYRLEPVHLRMAGYWEIALDIDAPAAQRAPSFGVCIE